MQGGGLSPSDFRGAVELLLMPFFPFKAHFNITWKVQLTSACMYGGQGQFGTMIRPIPECQKHTGESAPGGGIWYLLGEAVPGLGGSHGEGVPSLKRDRSRS